MKTHLICAGWIASLVLAFGAHAQTSSGTPAADEAALRDADAQWSKAASVKDLDAVVSFYSDDATVMPPNETIVVDRAGIRALWKSLLETPGLTLSWKATKAEVSRSGDLGYISGTYEMTTNGASKDRGKYLEVWEKVADGKWKCAADMFSSDLAFPAASDQKK